MGRVQRTALIAAASAAFAAPSRAEAVTLEVTAGSPVTALEARIEPLPRLVVTALAGEADGHAIRLGLGAGGTWWRGDHLALATELRLARVIGLDVVDSWDAELSQVIELRLDEITSARLRAGAIGYMGELPSQRGVIGFAVLRARVAVSPGSVAGVELGWMADGSTSRPMLGLVLEHDL